MAFTEGQFSWWHTVLAWRALSDLYWFFSCFAVSHKALKLVINKIIIKYIMSPEVENIPECIDLKIQPRYMGRIKTPQPEMRNSLLL